MKAHRFNKQLGFTLIELMAVVLIIGIIVSSSVVMFQSGGPKKELHDELEKFVELSHQLSDLSILSGEPLGLVVTPPAWSDDQLDNPGWAYQWMRFIEVPVEGGGTVGQWTAIEGIDVNSLPDTVQLFVHIEGHEWDWRSTPKSDVPIFVLYPTGEAEPFVFEIEFAHDDLSIEAQHIELDESGRLQWKEAREALLEIEGREA